MLSRLVRELESFRPETGTRREGETEFELSKSKAIDGNRLSRNEFSIALRGFESRLGRCNSSTHFVPPFVTEVTAPLSRR